MRARRTDANLKQIAAAFRKAGAQVHVTNGAWDLTVGYGGLTVLVECKDGSKPPSARKLTPAEREFHAQWTGGIRVVEDEDDVRDVMACLEKWRQYIHAGIAQDIGRS